MRLAAEVVIGCLATCAFRRLGWWFERPPRCEGVTGHMCSLARSIICEEDSWSLPWTGHSKTLRLGLS